MDFLDPLKRRRHRIRLMVGYGLMGIAIMLTAIVLVYWAYGYGFNTKTGNVVENGLLFIDSKPDGASVYLNGQPQNNDSPARLVLNAGNYELVIKKTGYVDWQRKFSLNAHNVTRIDYPLLLPKEPKSQVIKSYPSPPKILGTSPDRHWLLVLPANSAGLGSFELYDITKQPIQPPLPLNLPASLVGGSGQPGHDFIFLEWTLDGNRALLKHSFAGGVEFLLLNRSDPASSLNLNRLFNFNPTDVALFNKRADQFYLYSQADGRLQLGDVARASLQPLISRVLSYKPLDGNLLFYVTDQLPTTGQVAAKIYDGSKSYELVQMPAAGKYLINAVSYQAHWYYAVGSDSLGRVTIYKDPLDSLKNSSIAKAKPMIGLNNPGAQDLSVSLNERFFALQHGQKFVVYDIENQTRYQYEVSAPLSGIMKWMDGYRLVGVSNSSLLIMDFDAKNNRQFIPTLSNDFGFDKDYNRLFNLVPVDGGNARLQLTEIRTGADLPK